MGKLHMSRYRSLGKLVGFLLIALVVAATSGIWSEPLASYVLRWTAVEHLRHLVLVLGCCCAVASCVAIVRAARSADATRIRVSVLLPLILSVVLSGIGATRALWFQSFPIEQSVISLEKELDLLEQSMTIRLQSEQDWCNNSLAQATDEIRNLRAKVLHSPFECTLQARDLLLATRRKNLQRNDVYRVYSDLLLGYIARSRGEITVVTVTSELQRVGHLRRLYLKNIRSLQPATIQAFEGTPQGPATLCSSKFDLPFEVKVLTRSDVNGLRDVGGDSRDWYRRAFPTGSGLFSLSTVGFNQDATQALVSVSKNGPWPDSSGSWFDVLGWNGSAWILLETHLKRVS